ncbi:hypothetical protein D3C87_1563490 [compost metagenome]
MTVSEFKAWLEGFEEAMGGNPPSIDQWKAIKAKLAKIDGVLKPPVVYRGAEPVRHWM